MDGEILKISSGLNFAVARYITFVSNMIIVGKKQFFAKLPKMY